VLASAQNTIYELLLEKHTKKAWYFAISNYTMVSASGLYIFRNDYQESIKTLKSDGCFE